MIKRKKNQLPFCVWAVVIATTEAGKLQALAAGGRKGWKGLWDSAGETNRPGKQPSALGGSQGAGWGWERLGLPF